MWLILILMICFMTLVDRAQWFSERMAEGDRCEEMIVRRLNAELMMFGVVAITLFMLENSIELDHSLHINFEFIDILCSCGACTVIILGMLVFVVLGNLRRHYKDLMVTQRKFYDNIKEDKNHSMTLPPRFIEFYLLAAGMMDEFDLPYDFDFGVYTREMISQAVADMIDITPYTWIVLALNALLFWLITDSVEGFVNTDPSTVVGWFIAIGWFFFAVAVATTGAAFVGLNTLRKHVGAHNIGDACLQFFAASHPATTPPPHQIGRAVV